MANQPNSTEVIYWIIIIEREKSNYDDTKSDKGLESLAELVWCNTFTVRGANKDNTFTYQ